MSYLQYVIQSRGGATSGRLAGGCTVYSDAAQQRIKIFAAWRRDHSSSSSSGQRPGTTCHRSTLYTNDPTVMCGIMIIIRCTTNCDPAIYMRKFRGDEGHPLRNSPQYLIFVLFYMIM